MHAADSHTAFAVEVVRKLRAAGFQALWAGGCVRDLLLGIAPHDYDVATDARPEQVERVFGRRNTLAIGASFGVMQVRGERGVRPIEVATFRTDGDYSDGRRPDSVQFASPEIDAQRRDFTINGMFYDPVDKVIHDYVQGQADLAARVVRAIGDPVARFTEDKLRMLRAIRFTGRFGCTLDEATAAAVRAMAPQIVVVSAERIRQELEKVLLHSSRSTTLELARALGLLDIVLPELASQWREAGVCVDGPTGGLSRWEATGHLLRTLEGPTFETAFAALWMFHARTAELPRWLVRGVCRRLKMSNDETDLIEWLAEQAWSLADPESLPLHRLKRLLAHSGAASLLDLMRGTVAAGLADQRALAFCEQYLSVTPPERLNPPPLISGLDLQDLGLSPGPEFRVLLQAVRDAQLDEQISTRDAAMSLVAQLRDRK